MNDTEQDTLSPKEISQWARQEIANSAKAFELRVKEATDLATKYSTGEISPEEAKQRLIAYDHRWREALYGVSDVQNLTDEQILATIDETRRTGKLRISERGDSSNVRGGR
jgi:hypothetical protein